MMPWQQLIKEKVMTTPSLMCCGCSQAFTLDYTSDWLEAGIVARWISCPHCSGRFVLAYKHSDGKMTIAEPMSTSFQGNKDE